MSGRISGRFTVRPDTAALNTAIARLWHEGVSCNQIAARLGLTKNAVIGRRDRMGLPQRPSPIIRNGEPKPREPKPKRLSGSGALVGPTLPPQAVRAALRIAGVATSLPNAPQTVFRARPSHACCWPFGDPKKPGFRFCDSAAPAGEPYCPEHRAVAWVSVARRGAA